MKKIFIIVGESSGDLIGAELLKELKRKFKEEIDLRGVGGDNLKEQGLESLFPMKDLSVMGFLEVLPSIPRILLRMYQVKKELLKFKPDIIITIDSPDFNFRIIKSIKKKKNFDTKIIHYVAPSVWAYRPKRAKLVADLYDKLFTLLPFETKYFTKYGLDTVFVGNPLLFSKEVSLTKDKFLKKYQINRKDKLILLTLGSRKGEINRFRGMCNEIIQNIAKSNYHFILPTLKWLEKDVEMFCQNLPIKYSIITNDDDKKSCLKYSDFAIAKSGTNTMQIAHYGVPMVIFYKANPISYYFLKKIVQVRYANLININEDKEIIPEYLQYNCTAEKILKGVKKLINDDKAIKLQQDEVKKTLEKFHNKERISPAKKAAEEISKLL